MLLFALEVLTWHVLLLPVTLVLAFELYALARRRGWREVEAVVALVGGLLFDLPANYTWCWVAYGWWWPGAGGLKAYTVTARLGVAARAELDAVTRGGRKSLRGQLAMFLCRYMNRRDPGHVDLTAPIGAR